jgi:hypothetical protein
MSPAAVPRPDEALWESALLSSDTELLIGAARNYLGPVKTPYDKRDLVSRLAAFLRKPEIKAAVVSLLDGLDATILASLFLLGPVPESELRSLFEGELPLFDLGLRLANLQDRLLVFHFEMGGRRLVAPNPILAEELEAVVLDPRAVFGLGERGEAKSPAGTTGSRDVAGEADAAGRAGAVGSADAVALFAFLYHSPGSIRKGGSLTKKAAERAAAILPSGFRPPASEAGQARQGLAVEQAGDASERARAQPTRLEAMLRAFDAAGFLGSGEQREPELAGFSTALAAWGEALPAYLAAALAAGPEAADDGLVDGPRRVVETGAAAAAALASAPRDFVFSRGGLGRWLEIALRRARRSQEGEGAMGRQELLEALVSLGLVREEGEGLAVAMAHDAPAGGAGGHGPSAPAGMDAEAPPRLVAEGSHALHLLPEARLEERLFVGLVAKPVSFGKVWSFEVDRESARAAFSAGLKAGAVVARLESLAGRPLPQSLSFSLRSWEEEYLSLRLYRGFVLVADERQGRIVEQSKTLAPRIAEKLAPGVYVLAVSGAEEAAALLEEAGLEAPPEIHYGASPRPALMGLAAKRAFDSGVRLESPELDVSRNAGFAPPAAGGASLEDGVRERVAARAAAAVAPLASLAEGLSADLAPAVADGPAQESGAEGGPARARLDPRPRMELLEAVLEAVAFGIGDAAGLGDAAGARPPRGPAELRELSDRIERRLILTPRQLAVADVRPERLEANGLDYQGKVRIVERALRSPGDRLEILYRLPGSEPTRILARPVRLEKTEKGLVLEAEDLGTGSPVRVPLGAASLVRRMRASLFGEDT